MRDRHSDAVVKVDRRIRWHYTSTILHLRIGARGIEIVNFTTAAPRSPIPDDSSRYARTISRHADGISRYSEPPSAGPLLPLLRCIGGRIGSHGRRVKKSGRRHISTSSFACSAPCTLLLQFSGLYGCRIAYLGHGMHPRKKAGVTYVNLWTGSRIQKPEVLSKMTEMS